MEINKAFITGPIINNFNKDNDVLFKDFQTTIPNDGNSQIRHYFEVIAATIKVNRNLYQFELRALEMLAKDFKLGKTLTINHEKGLDSYIGTTENVLGFGATVDAVVVDNKLYVAAYISLNKTYPKGPFGNSEQLRDSILDGFVNQVSQSNYPLKSRCSVCGLKYPTSYRDYDDSSCQHYRGQQVIVEKGDDKTVETVHVIVEEAEAIELSLVQMGADGGTGITKKVINLSLNDFVDEERYNFLFGDKNKSSNNLDDGSEGFNQSNNEGDEKMSQEAMQALQSRAENAEKDAATLRVEIESLKNDKIVFESQATATQSQITSLETEKKALLSQVDTITADRDLVKTQLEESNNSIQSKNKEISTLKQDAADNQVVIADGKSAREEFEKEYVESYVSAVGDDCTNEDRELQEEICKSFNIETLKKKTKGFKKSASDNYPNGKAIDENDDDEDESDSKSKEVPIGVGMR